MVQSLNLKAYLFEPDCQMTFKNIDKHPDTTLSYFMLYIISGIPFYWLYWVVSRMEETILYLLFKGSSTENHWVLQITTNFPT